MYGLVNKAIKHFVIETHDKQTWSAISEKASVDDDMFLAMEAYDDKITYDLVHAASNHLSIEASEILTAFGEYWIEFAEKQGYGSMLDLAGNNIADFTKNLDLMHTHIAQSYQKMRPPSFHCEELSSNSLKLIYSSERDGLHPFVKGLILGLGKRFKLHLKIKEQPLTSNSHEFIVSYSNQL